MDTVLRFKKYLDTKGIKNAQAERECGLSNGLIKSALSAGSAFGSDKLEKILIAYPDLSAEWLLRGTGNMILSDFDELLNRSSNIATDDNKTTSKEVLYKHLLKELTKANMVKAKAEAIEKEIYAKMAEEM